MALHDRGYSFAIIGRKMSISSVEQCINTDSYYICELSSMLKCDIPSRLYLIGNDDVCYQSIIKVTLSVQKRIMMGIQ